MKSHHLPPLDLLVPFEASARLGSFTRAAEELSVTQSAVSQRVRKLESLLDIPLFDREHRAIVLTAQGRELLNGVKVALQHLTSATQSLRQRDTRPFLRLGCDTSIAQLWLLPRLAPLLTQETPFAIDLIASDQEQEVLSADVAVMHGDGNWPGFVARPLFADEIYPVCAPDYLARRPISTPDDLLRADLIDLDYMHWNWMNWGIWMTETGLDPSAARILMRTNSYMALLDAARAGLGVALGWDHLVEAALRDGSLVRPLAESTDTHFGYHILLRQGASENAHQLAQLIYTSV
ncbi:LysR family transcriptional regulator [Roseovarius faecimaris]|uniref:LysR family transcriptional regulator n=1 Tax=Roseovarius faecimaris TaxID=2494550 RepID=A0A6I6ITT9_9RHOB|nr:LysR substrate-binding domain-containing protein [Roseovarius faecimaris]QGX98907.1 LysR family transcriptional regulator [Roseovarius faecimaris]